MTAEQAPIDISNNPLLQTLVEETRLAQTARPLVIGDRVVATLIPADVPQRPRPARRRRTKGAQRNDWLRGIIGIATGPDDGIHDAAVNHDKYLADAYADTHE